jgi:hypothetical protein
MGRKMPAELKGPVMEVRNTMAEMLEKGSKGEF